MSTREALLARVVPVFLPTEAMAAACILESACAQWCQATSVRVLAVLSCVAWLLRYQSLRAFRTAVVAWLPCLKAPKLGRRGKAGSQLREPPTQWGPVCREQKPRSRHLLVLS